MSNSRAQQLCILCGPIAICLFMVGVLLCGFLPPPSPHDSALKIAHLYADHTDRIRAGLVLMMIGGAFTGPFCAAICIQMRRVEGDQPVFSYTELGFGFIGILFFIIPCFMMEAAAFRPLRDPELTRTLNDLAWIPFVGAFMPAVMQNLAIAFVVFKDEAQKVFPRWLGYFNVWVALLFLPAALLNFFKTGPFAWNGIFCFWLPLTVFGVWFFVMWWVVRGAILKQGEEAVT